MAYTNRWHSILISVTVATWTLSQPLFDYIISNNALQRAGTKDIIVLMAVYQWLPVVLLFTFDRVVCRFGAGVFNVLQVWRLALFGLAALAFVRTLHLGGHLPFADSSGQSFLELVVIGFLTVVLLILAYRFYRPVTLLFLYLAAVSLVLTGMFVGKMGPLERGWAYAPSGSSLPELDDTIGLTPVFLFVFDALGAQVLLKDEEIDQGRFPHLAELGSESAVFINATANYMDTHSSVTTMLNGKFFPNGASGVDSHSNPASSVLLEILADAEYSVEFHSNYFSCRQKHLVCQDRAIWSAQSPHYAARNFAIWFLPTDIARFVRGAVLSVLPQQVTIQLPIETIHRGDLDQWSRFLARVTNSPAEGRVYLFHSLLTHRPYEFDRYGMRVSTLSPGRLEGDFETMGRAYEEQVMFLDSLVGDFLSRLKQKGLYDRSLIVVTGDHGPRSLGLRRTHSGLDYATEYPTEIDNIIPWVPLIVHGPGITPQTSSVDYQHVDLLPTVLDVLGIKSPTGLDGVSGFSPARPQREKEFHVYPLKEGPQGKVTYFYDDNIGKWRRNDQ